MKYSELSQSLSQAIADNGCKAVFFPKYLSHIRKTFIVRFPHLNGKLYYADSTGALLYDTSYYTGLPEYDPSSDSDCNFPVIGDVEYLDLTVSDTRKWERKTFGI